MEAIIQSMTPAERENPKLLNSSRKKRIAAGSGTQVVDVNRLLKQFEMIQNHDEAAHRPQNAQAYAPHDGQGGQGLPRHGRYGRRLPRPALLNRWQGTPCAFHIELINLWR